MLQCNNVNDEFKKIFCQAVPEIYKKRVKKSKVRIKLLTPVVRKLVSFKDRMKDNNTPKFPSIEL